MSNCRTDEKKNCYCLHSLSLVLKILQTSVIILFFTFETSLFKTLIFSGSNVLLWLKEDLKYMVHNRDDFIVHECDYYQCLSLVLCA